MKIGIESEGDITGNKECKNFYKKQGFCNVDKEGDIVELKRMKDHSKYEF